jgi:two-component system LytT family response regulator/two-component system response regulator LytT
VSDAALRTLVVDDEPLARDRLVGFLRALDDVDVIGEARDGVEALQLIESERPALVFLDVQMPGMDGFEVLKALHGPLPHVVFATAYDEYAIRAFEVEAVDYLLKPLVRARVEEAVARARARLSQGRGQDLDRVLRERPHLTQVPLTVAKRILIVPAADIMWFGVEFRLVYAHTHERGYMTNFTLRELEERLDPAAFFRAHKSALVNLAHVREIVPQPGGRWALVMRDDATTQVALSRTQARALRARLGW